MSAAAFARSIDEFCAECLNIGAALNISSHVVRRMGKNRFSVKWASVQEREYYRFPDLDLREYLECLRCGDFSLLLEDGGILQVSANFEGGEIFESRFYYLPCPIRFERAELEVGGELYPLEDFIDELSPGELRERMCIRAPFRFELDPDNKRLGHPLNHVHIGPSSARIPVGLSMCWYSFSRFIFKNFYPDRFAQVEGLLQHPSSFRPSTLNAEEAYELHMTFRCGI